MNQLLREFNNNPALRDEVKNYLLQFLDHETLRRVYNDGSSSGSKEAREAILGGFEKLSKEYSPRKGQERDTRR